MAVAAILELFNKLRAAGRLIYRLVGADVVKKLLRRFRWKMLFWSNILPTQLCSTAARLKTGWFSAQKFFLRFWSGDSWKMQKNEDSKSEFGFTGHYIGWTLRGEGPKHTHKQTNKQRKNK